jgi:hypothetical protein
MIRPKVRAVESERAALKRNVREIFDLRRRFTGVEPGDAPILVPLLRPAQDMDQPSDERMPADFRADRKDLENVPLRIELEDTMLIPLTQVKAVANDGSIARTTTVAFPTPSGPMMNPPIMTLSPISTTLK